MTSARMTIMPTSISIHIPYPTQYPYNDVYLNHGKDDESIAGDGGDAEGVEDEREPEPREAGGGF